MAIREWHLTGASPHTIRLEHGYWSGRTTISVDGQERYRRGVRLIDFGLIHRFELDSAEVELRATVVLPASYRYELHINGEPKDPVSVPPATPWVIACLIVAGLSCSVWAFPPISHDIPHFTRLLFAGAWIAAGIASIPLGLIATDRLIQRHETAAVVLVGLVAMLGTIPAFVLIPLSFIACGYEWPD